MDQMRPLPHTAPPAGLVECNLNKLVVQLYWLMDKYSLMWLKFWFQVIWKLSRSLKFPFSFYFGLHLYGSQGCIRLFTYHKICWSTVAENPFQKTVWKKTFMMTECIGCLTLSRFWWGLIPFANKTVLMNGTLLTCLFFCFHFFFFFEREETSPRLPIHPRCPQLNWDCASEGGQPSRLLEYDWGTTTARRSKWLGASH